MPGDDAAAGLDGRGASSESDAGGSGGSVVVNNGGSVDCAGWGA
jgi:hypothetical protein